MSGHLTDLFRKEVWQNVTRRVDGEVMLAIPVSTRLISILLVLIILVGIIYISTATYARRVTVEGWITPEGGVVRATATRGGQIEHLFVSEGEMVEAGDGIARLRLSTFTDGGDSATAILASLDLQANAAARAAEAEIAQLENDQSRISATLEGLLRERDNIRVEIALQRDRVSLAETEMDRATTIADRGFISVRDLDRRQETLLQSQQVLAGLLRQESGLDRQIVEQQQLLESIPARISASNASSEAAAAVLAERIHAINRDAHNIVRAPISSQIAALPVRRGQPLVPGQTVAVLIPRDDELVGELYVPSRAAGFIRAGQEVRLMYQAFPHQRFGTGTAFISHISTTVLAPNEVAIPGLVLAEPVFRVELHLSRGSISAYGGEVQLQPGMLMSADIIIDRRTLLEWLFDPLFAAASRG